MTNRFSSSSTSSRIASGASLPGPYVASETHARLMNVRYPAGFWTTKKLRTRRLQRPVEGIPTHRIAPRLADQRPHLLLGDAQRRLGARHVDDALFEDGAVDV